MSDGVFLTIYLAGAVLAYVVRVPFVRSASRGEIREDRLDFREAVFNVISFVGIFILPFNKLGGGLPRLAYTLPAWAGWIGTAVLLGAIVLLWRAHVDLGRNWSATVRVREGHALITDGVYGVVRHPIYAAHWLIVISQPLLVRHWVFGFAGLPAFALVFLYRLPREEAMMVKVYGDEYREYMRRVGGVLPRLGRLSL
jgi:protein-S-isoprenylcysteine O-methyltransferase Ste14